MLGMLRFQKTFEILHRVSLIGMNIGGSSNPKDSGEMAVLYHVKNYLKDMAEITLFDVGANIGKYSVLVKDVFGEQARVYAFEPSHKTFQTLQANLGDKNGVKIYNFGFGDKNSKEVLFSDLDQSGLASIYKRNLDHLQIVMNKEEEVEIKTLDVFVEEHDINHIHLLKLDVEGHEKKVLDGAAKMLKSGAIDFIQFEFGGCNLDSRTYFRDFYYLLHDNYKIYRIVKDGLYQIYQYKEMYEIFVAANYLAEKR